MSAYSTINITRSKATQLYIGQFFELTDEELENFMDKLLEPKLYNCNIVPDTYENDDCLI